MDICEVRGLRREYGPVVALKSIDLRVERGGQIIGLLGPNGAGKTTLVEIMEGLRAPTSGNVRVLGLDPGTQPNELRSRLGVQLQATALMPELTVVETLTLFASFYSKALKPSAVLPGVDLEDKAKAKVKDLSGGQKQRLALALAMQHEPDFFILDEPTSGLDPIARRQIHEILRALRGQGKTILVSSHYLDEIEALSDRVIILKSGAIVADGTPMELLSRAAGRSTLWISLEDKTIDPASFLPGCSFEGRDGELLRYTTHDPTDAVTHVADALRASNTRLLDLRLKRPTLEDLYIQLIGDIGPATTTLEAAH